MAIGAIIGGLATAANVAKGFLGNRGNGGMGLFQRMRQRVQEMRMRNQGLLSPPNTAGNFATLSRPNTAQTMPMGGRIVPPPSKLNWFKENWKPLAFAGGALLTTVLVWLGIRSANKNKRKTRR